MAYCLAGAVLLVQRGEALWSLAMVFWAVCLGLMVQQQLAKGAVAATWRAAEVQEA